MEAENLKYQPFGFVPLVVPTSEDWAEKLLRHTFSPPVPDEFVGQKHESQSSQNNECKRSFKTVVHSHSKVYKVSDECEPKEEASQLCRMSVNPT